MLESLLIIWLLIGFVISLSAFLWDIYKADYYTLSLTELFGYISVILSGPIIFIPILLDLFKVNLDDKILFKLDRRNKPK
jgi:hypothetical protein